MKCGEWIYPMEPGKSPVLQTQHRTYMFPDISIQEVFFSDDKKQNMFQDFDGCQRLEKHGSITYGSSHYTLE